MATATATLAKQKERRQRMIVLAGGVILVLLLIIQVPRILKRTSSPAAPAPASTPAAPAASPTGTTPVPAAAASTELSELDITPVPSPGQLVTFSRFESKDPFAQQISEETAAPATSPTSTPTAPATTAPATPTPTTPATPTTITPAPTAPAPSTSTSGNRALSGASAPISVNGKAETVEVGALFPKGEKIFRLVSVTANSATISIAGGSFESGATTATLTIGRTLTLMNKSNGKHYSLRLLSIS
jgi:cytoskeletal protein RodZ